MLQLKILVEENFRAELIDHIPRIHELLVLLRLERHIWRSENKTNYFFSVTKF